MHVRINATDSLITLNKNNNEGINKIPIKERSNNFSITIEDNPDFREMPLTCFNNPGLTMKSPPACEMYCPKNRLDTKYEKYRG